MCRGVLNVTCLASWVFVMASMTAWELSSLGTLNSTIPMSTDAGYDRRVKGLVESSKTQKVVGIMTGVVLCCTWVVKNTRNDCVLPSCGYHVHGVLLKVHGFRLLLGGEILGAEGSVLT